MASFKHSLFEMSILNLHFVLIKLASFLLTSNDDVLKEHYDSLNLLLLQDILHRRLRRVHADTPATLGSTLHKTILWIFSCISPWSTLDLLCFILLFTMKPTYGLQALHMDKSFKYNSMQTLVHRDCHQLPKPHMGASMLFQSPPFW